MHKNKQGTKRKRPVVEVVPDSEDENNSDDEAELEAMALAEIQAENAAREREENNEDDEEEEEDETKNLDYQSRMTMINNAINELKSDLPWVELLDLSSKPFDIVNVEDDLSRETLFYSVALAAVKEGRAKLDEEKIPHRRPEDYFAEMVKTDDHMKKIKESLIHEKQKIEAYATRRSDQDQRKFAKKVHAAKLQEKSDAKKEHNNTVSKWRETNKGAGKDNLEADFNKHFLGGANKKGEFKSPVNKKREGKDKKYGVLGQPARYKKKNDSKSSSDMREFKPFKKGGGDKASPSPTYKRGRSKDKKPNRPGKEARNAKRQRTK